MFRENKDHLQQELFNSYSTMNPKVQASLQGTWAPLFYEHVFCKIDETPFSYLYSLDNGRPNFPVNILLSLEFIKHMKDYTDEDILEQFRFNYQVMYAVGLRNLGELYLAERTLYEFRRRVYRYTVENPNKNDLIFGQFEKLTRQFIELARINTKEQRVDSTQIMTNIKLAGRLSLAYDVLTQALAACPPELLTDSLKYVLEPEYKTKVLYRSRSSESQKRIQEMIELGLELISIIEPNPSIRELNAMAILQRFINEQAIFDSEKNAWVAKANQEIAATSLQSAHDPDVTYRKKTSKGHVGLVLNIAETCSDENPVQLVTDYLVEKNSISDAEMLEKRLPEIKKKMEVTDFYVDGGYFSGEVEKQAQPAGITIHYTDMTGKKPDPEKLSLTSFTIKDHQTVEACPEGHTPYSGQFNGKNKVILAYFDRNVCSNCPRQDACPVKFRKNNTVLRVEQSAIFLAEARERQEDKKARKEATSKRTAIEGTNSSLKRSQGAGRLKVRGKVKATLVTGMKIIGHNFKQIVRFFKGDIRKKATEIINNHNQGVIVPIC
jgi:tetratricopeptide (TPR) repeat protein